MFPTYLHLWPELQIKSTRSPVTEKKCYLKLLLTALLLPLRERHYFSPEKNTFSLAKYFDRQFWLWNVRTPPQGRVRRRQWNKAVTKPLCIPKMDRNAGAGQPAEKWGNGRKHAAAATPLSTWQSTPSSSPAFFLSVEIISVFHTVYSILLFVSLLYVFPH